MIVMAFVDRRVTLRQLLRNWTIVLFGNLVGSLATVWLVYQSGLLVSDLAIRAAQIAESKVALDPIEAMSRGILCNALDCLAVWLSVSARTTIGMIMSIVWPITAFVAIGLEHSVANMYLIPAGWLSGAPISLVQAAGNILPVLLGNIVGGAGGVALAYRLAYGKPAEEVVSA
jgi:formate/nitrite transporter